MSSSQATKPVEIKPHTKSKVLEIDWADGHVTKLTYEYLRVECPCADCKGHTPDQAKTIAGKENVDITDFKPVGNYAIQPVFDDGHDTGIFSWDLLRRLDTSAEA